MILLHRKRIPPLRRLLIVESGDRAICEKVLAVCYGFAESIDIVTCYHGQPATYRDGTGNVYRTQDYATPEQRRKLMAELASHQYGAIGIICSGEAVMEKWKWWLAWKVPAKLFIINENADFFFVDYSNWTHVKSLLGQRTGLSGGGASLTIARVLLLPLTFAYLLVYAGTVHLVRRARL